MKNCIEKDPACGRNANKVGKTIFRILKLYHRFKNCARGGELNG